MKELYSELLKTDSKDKWQRIGIQKRSGYVLPLFSVYSKSSTGIGEFTDLKLACDWAKLAGLSIIQLLPLNDTGFNFRPYDCQSGFALEPVYLNLWELKGVDISKFSEEIKNLREKFPISERVNYNIKREKLNILQRIFKEIKEKHPLEFLEYRKKNNYWIEDYAIFKVLKEENNERSWEDWDLKFRDRDNTTLETFKRENKERIEFYIWLQWQTHEQFKRIKLYAEEKGIYLMGDLPFLVCRDSADVWAKRDYFRLDLSSGAPPDMYYAKGQRWGMPPYNWEKIAKSNYDYVIEKLRYAENFYDIFRIDHVVGVFRIWSIPLTEPSENFGLNGFFEPKDEKVWEEHGKRILTVFIKNTKMLSIAEDLGTVPECSYKVLKELGIPGTEVLRWNKDWQKTYKFKRPEDFRSFAIATLSTHDSSNLEAWWNFEAGTVDEELFVRICREKGVDFEKIKERLFDLNLSFYKRLYWKKEINNPERLLDILELNKEEAFHIIDLYKGSYSEKEKFQKDIGMEGEPQSKVSPLFFKKTLEYITKTNSIFCINLLFDWLSLSGIFSDDCWQRRINFPGTISEKNWSYVMPISLEEMLNLEANREIKEINKKSNRI